MNDKLMSILLLCGKVILIIALGLLVIKILLAIEKKMLKHTRLDEALHLFILKSTKVILIIILAIMAIQATGASTTSLVTVLGACGAAIALALKDSLGNVAGGILILLNKPFSKGDSIEISGPSSATGIVDSIDLMVTKLHTYDNKIVIVPNGSITTSVIVNFSEEGVRRVDCTFGVSYDSDLEKVKNVMRQVVSECEEIKKDSEPVIGVSNLGADAVIMDCKVWCETADYFSVKYYLEENIKKAFDREGIKIPYPQMDIHIVDKEKNGE